MLWVIVISRDYIEILAAFVKHNGRTTDDIFVAFSEFPTL